MERPHLHPFGRNAPFGGIESEFLPFRFAQAEFERRISELEEQAAPELEEQAALPGRQQLPAPKKTLN